MKKIITTICILTSMFSQSQNILGENGARYISGDVSIIENPGGINAFGAYVKRLSLDSVPYLGIMSYGNSVSMPYSVAAVNEFRKLFPFNMVTYPTSFNSAVQDWFFNGVATYADTPIINQNSGYGHPGADFTYISSGDHWILAANDSLKCSTGFSQGFDVFRVYFAKFPNGGNVTVTLRDAVADTVIGSQTINTQSDTISAAKVEFTGINTLLRLKCAVTCTSDTVIGLKVVYMYANKSIVGLQGGRGGSSLYQNLYSNRAILSYLLSDFNIRWIMVSAKEEYPNTSFPALGDTLSKYNPISKLMIGSLPDVGSDTNQIANNRKLRAMSYSKGFSYVDGYNFFKGYQGMVSNGLQGDGVHSSGMAYEDLMGKVISQQGWLNLGEVSKENIDNTNPVTYGYVKTAELYGQTYSTGLFPTHSKLIMNPAASSSPGKVNFRNINYLMFGDDLNSNTGIEAYSTIGLSVRNAGMFRTSYLLSYDASATNSFIGSIFAYKYLLVNAGNAVDGEFIARGTTDNNLIHTHAVNNNTGFGTAFPEVSAIVDASSTTKGFLMPRMNSSQVAAISSPASGLWIINSDSTYRPFIYNGSAWKPIAYLTDIPTPGGVTSITGTSNQVIASASTGAVTLSLDTTNTTSTKQNVWRVKDSILAVFNAANDAGRYTSTTSNHVNITSLSYYTSHWSRIKNQVTVSGEFSVTPTSPTATTSLDITLPNGWQASGSTGDITVVGSVNDGVTSNATVGISGSTTPTLTFQSLTAVATRVRFTITFEIFFP